MNLNQFLTELPERGIKLWLEGDTLRFRAPKGVMTSEDRDLLVLHKAKVISLLSQSNTSANDTDRTIVPVSEKRDLPLSFPQEQLWFLNQLDPNNVSYNELFALRFLGVLNIVALEQSLNKIVARHAALRTNFTTINGQPVQVIAESLTLTVPVIDLSNLPACDRENEVQRLATEQAQKPFNLVSDPLIQGTVLKLTETEHIFLLRTHHIVWDGWSLGVMWRELAAFYNDLSQELPPLPAQYPDFAVWQRQYLTGEVLDSLQTYWKEQLLDAPPLLELPTDRARGVTQTFRGKHYRFVISKPLTEGLIGLSRRQKVTLFMTLLAAFQTLLYRYTEQTDLCVRSPIANRDRPEFEGVIGFFVNTLVLRTCLSGNPSFEDLLSRVRKVTLEAYAHRELPFEKLVEILQPERSLSYTPLFQAMLMLLNELPDIQMEGLKVSPLAVETGITHFDLVLFIENTSSGLIGEWEYNIDLFDDATIARMTGHFQTLLEGIVANPKARVSDLPLLIEAERHQLLVEWNNTTMDYPQDKCIHQLFEEQVERSPDAVAVVFEGEQLTYQELNARANQLAHYLQTLGVGSEVLVGICVERSLEMVIGILGILKAGGAYVPLDPSYPVERLAFMIEDTQVPVLLTQSSLLPQFPEHQAQIICLDTDWQIIAQSDIENPVNSVSPDNLAYVIYTSGSTGKPKGVMNTHKGIYNRLLWMQDTYQLSECDRVLQKTPFGFDVSVWEFFWTLMTGACLVVARPEGHKDSAYLAQLVTEQQITTLHFVPSMLQAFLQEPNLEGCQCIKRIICSGEALPFELQERCFERLNAELHNLYGPTEAAIDVTFWVCQKSSHHRIVPIGRAIANTQIYLLDAHLHPVPIGVAGELHIGGLGLARGYLNRPDLTAERFIPNPFNNEPGSRLYKTGDLARYLNDGNIEYLGRIDDQVKIRGFRIELGEIEAALTQYPEVQQAIVIVREDKPDTKQLVAYVVPQQKPELTLGSLRQFLKEKLPQHMIPSAFVLMDALLLTPNGKIDRRALPAPEFHPELEQSFIAPRTPVEETLASIWATVLRIGQVGIHDNFFDLGGHSLLATQITSRISKAFQIELPLQYVFDAPTVALLGERIDKMCFTSNQEQTCSQTAVGNYLPLLSTIQDTYIPLSVSQEYIWRLQQSKTNSCLYNCGAAVRLKGLLCLETLEKSINEIIRRHAILRTHFVITEGQPMQGTAPFLSIPLKMIDIQNLPLDKRTTEAQKICSQEYQHHFDLAVAPLIKTTLIRLTQDEHWLLITTHHLIADGWSFDILFQELGILYSTFLNNLPSPLPEVSLQYADYSLWERQSLNEEVLKKQRFYWLQKLSNLSKSVDLPLNEWSQRTTTLPQVASYSTLLPDHLVVAIQALSCSQGVSIFVIILTALKILLFKWSGQTDILVATTIGNRSIPETEQMVGCFINDVILRSRINDSQTRADLLRQIKQTVHEAINNKYLSFQEIVEILRNTGNDLPITASITMNPPIKNHNGLLEYEVVSFPTIPEFWHEHIPLDFFVSSPTEDYKTIQIEAFYNAEIFKGEIIEHLFSYYQEILQDFTESPELAISAFKQF